MKAQGQSKSGAQSTSAAGRARGAGGSSGAADAPRVVAQRKQFQSMFGGAIQRQGAEEEELLQGKVAPVQRIGFGTATGASEEEFAAKMAANDKGGANPVPAGPVPENHGKRAEPQAQVAAALAANSGSSPVNFDNELGGALTKGQENRLPVGDEPAYDKNSATGKWTPKEKETA